MTTKKFKDGNLSKSQNGIITFNEIPDLELYLKAYAIPPVSLGTIPVATPDHDDNIAGNKLIYDPLTVTFLVDEELLTHSQLLEWMIKSKGYESQHAQNCTLHVLSNKGNVIRHVNFTGVWPFQLGEVQFDLNADDELISTCTFNITDYKYGDIIE